ncbi:ArsS family sensor histidine kinase [Sulfurovum sp.]|uniref:ArsS family sensor histidine kinase n=1 Tax=Sulfurovum sp. TaxID=1969726 RepID=UPI002867FD7C|nr:ArsS family sensor histidine kinase [Sulfurovum sp.]
MRNLSVTTFIHILFSVAILILVATFLLFLSWDKDRHKIEEYKHYQLVSITFLSKLQLNPGKETLTELYEDLRVKEVPEKEAQEIKKGIETQGKTVFTGGSSAGKVRVFSINDTHYIYVQRMEHNLLLKDDRPENYYFEIAVTLGIFLIVLLLLLYLAVLKKLQPLKKLHKQIQRFAQGDTQTRITYLYDDEIGKIAKSFDDAIMYINTLSASKNLFMRNLMHELKTPITKGRIVVEMIEDEATKKVLIRAFERMNELISELAEIERVTTQSFEPNFEYIMLDEVIQKSQELLMTVKGQVIIEVQNRALTTDAKLLSLAIKNLLDNGIKYSKNKQVTLKSAEDGLEVISQGEKLQHPLSYYIEPFSQEEKRSSGFGLGLYIVHSIVEKLGCGLEYKYVDGNNIFVITAGKSCRFS